MSNPHPTKGPRPLHALTPPSRPPEDSWWTDAPREDWAAIAERAYVRMHGTKEEWAVKTYPPLPY